MKLYRLTRTLIAIAIIAAIVSPLAAGDAEALGTSANVDELIDEVAEIVLANVESPGIGQTGGDWAVVALMRSGAAIPDGYVKDYYNKVSDELVTLKGLLSELKYTEYSRVALGMAAIGADPRSVGGYDLLARLSDFDATVYQGINGAIFAIIAFGAAGGGDEYAAIADKYIDYILSRQLEDGGFTLSGSISDPDTTAMAVSALSRYIDRVEVKDSIGRAIVRLSAMQRPTGGYTSFSSTNSESVAQVIIALSSMGIPLDDDRFVKNGVTLLDNLLTFYISGQGFEHEKDGGVSLMSTEQSLCALAALKRMLHGDAGLFDMVDAPEFTVEDPVYGLEGRHPDVAVPGIMPAGAAFIDIGGHKYEDAIIALSSRGIINGYSYDEFSPDKTISRAEFAAIIVRALGLRLEGGQGVEVNGSEEAAGSKQNINAGLEFMDVQPESWFYEYAVTAYKYGIIYGRSSDVFDPGGLINRQEAALMLSRAANLCGLDILLDDTAVRNILSAFVDYRSAAPWASEALAFCCYFGIIDDSEMELSPGQPALRGECADMVFRMLDSARLLEG